MTTMPRRSKLTWVAGLVILAGIAIRLRLFAAARSFWSDEAAIALNVVARSFGDLLRPLDYRQMAPPLFLWLERLAILLAGPNEWSLRALPFVAGAATLAVLWHVGRKLLPNDAAIVSLALIALSPQLIYFSNELKPYAVDAFVTVALLALALAVRDRPDDARRWVTLVFGGAVAVLLSTTAPFTLVGVGAFLVLTPAVRTAPKVTTYTIIGGVAWLAVGGAMLVVHREMMSSTGVGKWMHAFWDFSFLTTDPPGLRMRAWTSAFGALKWTFIDGESRAHELAVLGAATALGLLRLFRRGGVPVVAMIALPFACLILAAATRTYPFAARLVLFAAPLTALMLASGVTWPGSIVASRVSQPVGAAITVALVGVLLMMPARNAWRILKKPPGLQELRPLIQTVARARKAGPNADPVWVTALAELPWRFYAGDSLSGVDSVARLPLAGSNKDVAPGVLVGNWWHGGDGGREEMERLHATVGRTSCAWLIFALADDDERTAVLAGVRQLRGRIVETRELTGSALYRICFQ